MKKVLFALPVLALSLFLAFCNKPNVQEELNAAQQGGGVSTERGTCDIQLFADNLNQLRICGIPVTNKTACTDCGLNSKGVEFVNGYAYFSSVNTPVTFSVTNLGATSTWVRISSGTPGNFIEIPAGSCQTYTVTNFCTVL